MSQATLDFSAYIAERTRDFTGRQWVFAEIDRWLASGDAPRYFIITGEPGIGKTAIAARLTQVRNDMAAHHFCIARQADTIDPLNFARSLSHQLTRIDGFAKSILEDSSVHLEAWQTVQEVYGQVINVQIENLVINAPTATVAFNRIVGDPVRQLYANGLDRQLVILVDALDEAVQQGSSETIVDLLANAQGLPPQIRFVLTSRPEAIALHHFEQLHIPHLVLNAGREENQADVRAYIHHRLATSDGLQAQLAEQGIVSQAFIERVAEASGGNFLYLVWLLRGIAEGTQRFDSLEALPEGLDGIYREFLRTRKAGRDIDQWRDRYRTLLGMLVAARESLRSEQLARFTRLSEQEVNDLLLDVQQFLDPPLAATGQYRLYHQSVADFLGSKKQAQEFWIDLAQIHRQSVDCCRGRASTWEAVNWEQASDYEKRYLAAHLYALWDVESCRQDLYTLVESQSWTAAKYLDTPWVGSLVQDLQLASTLAAEGNVKDWSRSMGYQLRRALVEEMMSHMSDGAILFLTKLGQVERALDLARRQWNKSRLLRKIAQIVAPTTPSKAVDILVETSQLVDSENVLGQCKARLATAQDILRLAPSHSHLALDLIEEAKRLERAISESDLIKYKVAWDLPTLTLTGDLNAALATSGTFSPLQQAQALRHISSVLPEDHPAKQNLIEQALLILKPLEQTPEARNERMRAIVFLLPLVDKSRQQELLRLLRSDGDYLQSVGAPEGYTGTQHWVIERVAKVDLAWAKHMLLESDWRGALEAYAVVREIARVDYEEALQLIKERFSNHALGSKLLVDVIGIVALEDTDKAETLIEEYAKQLRDDEGDAYIAVAEAYLARGDDRKAQEIFNKHAAVPDSEGFAHARENLQLAILARSSFLPVEVACDRLMQFPVCPRCHRSREQEAEVVLARMAVRQNKLDILEQYHVGRDAQLVTAAILADCVSAEAARRYWDDHHLTFVKRVEAEKVNAHITSVEVQQDPGKLGMLMEHFDGDGKPHHFCPYMRKLPHTLRKLVETGKIESQKAVAIIEQLYLLLVDWECTREDQPPKAEFWKTRCDCYNYSERVLAQLIGVMALLDPDRSDEMVKSLPAQPIKVYALEQILHHTKAYETMVPRIIETGRKCIQDPRQRAESCYILATWLPTEMSDTIKHLIDLAEPLVDKSPTHYRTNRLGMRISIGPSSIELKKCKARALMGLVGDVGQFEYAVESLKTIESLIQLDDKLQVLDLLAQQADGWPKEDKLTLLKRLWELSITRNLTDVQTFVAFSVPLVYSLGGEEAFWRLYKYIEWAYEELPQVD
jgi:hypothetical protein